MSEQELNAFEEQRPPRSWHSAWPYPLLAGVSLAAGELLSLEPRWLLLAPVSLLLAGLWQWGQGLRGLQESRRTADGWLRNGVRARARWRAQELTSPQIRRQLAKSLRRMVTEAERRTVRPGPSVFCRSVVRAEKSTLLALAARLHDLERSLAPQGVVLLTDLLQDGSSPFFDAERAPEVTPRLRAALAALEPECDD
jgi:hypothetical protein